jgi:hypothetical protein
MTKITPGVNVARAHDASKIVILAPEHRYELDPYDETRQVTGPLDGPQDQRVALATCSA